MTPAASMRMLPNRAELSQTLHLAVEPGFACPRGGGVASPRPLKLARFSFLAAKQEEACSSVCTAKAKSDCTESLQSRRSHGKLGVGVREICISPVIVCWLVTVFWQGSPKIPVVSEAQVSSAACGAGMAMFAVP